MPLLPRTSASSCMFLYHFSSLFFVARVVLPFRANLVFRFQVSGRMLIVYESKTGWSSVLRCNSIRNQIQNSTVSMNSFVDQMLTMMINNPRCLTGTDRTRGL